ncbi:MAG: Ig-like domain-containing protein [Muribaculaceae bacterium]|nr:Ig-like domain-containing protein [Muribaculaceae bacterium]
MHRFYLSLRFLPVLAAACVLVACANMGRPEGGPRDETPPVYVRSNPKMGQLRFDGKRIMVEFDENITLEDAMNKIVVSPAQKTTPAISTVGRRVYIELRDSLVPDMTYTVDFADAVRDLNEGNILDGLALDFSTGETIDTLRISGMVFEARTLEPAQGMLVGVYSNLSDTAITTLPLERITKTNQLGQFTIRGLSPGEYKVFAVNDVNRDYHWDRSEDIAFYDVTVSPSSMPTTVTDTLVSTQTGLRDSVVTRGATAFLPNDLLLTWFNEGYSSQYLKEYKRPALDRISLTFGTKADTLPTIKLVNTHRAGDDISTWAALDANARLDSLQYWITDTTLSDLDSIFISATYMRTDTLGELSLTTDTLRLINRGQFTKKRRMEAAQKAQEALQKRIDHAIKHNEEVMKINAKRREEGKDTMELMEMPTAEKERKYIDFKMTSPTLQDLNTPMVFKSATPVATFDRSAVSMQMEVDSVWYPVKAPEINLINPLSPMVYTAPYDWEEGTRYRITIDSAAIVDINGLHNRPITQDLTTKTRADYSTLTLNISGLEGRNAVVELLNSDNPVMKKSVEGNNAYLEYINPGPYYVRLFIDSNGDGEWTTGSVADSIQPEEVYYFPKKINLRKNWDVEQEWNINELPVDMQKPQEIKKNKPKLKKGEKPEGGTDDEEEDEFFDDPFMRDATRNNGLGSGTRTGNGRLKRAGSGSQLVY